MFMKMSKCVIFRYSILTGKSNITLLQNQLQKIIFDPFKAISQCVFLCDNKVLEVNSTLSESSTEHELSLTDIKCLIINHPKLHFISPKIWVESTNILTSNGFKINEVKRIYYIEPRILELKPETIQNSITAMRDLKLGEKDTLQIFNTKPVLFLLQPKSFTTRYKQLDKCFPHKDIKRIIKESSEVLFEDWASIMAKINYVLFKMGLEQDDIVRASALKYPVSFIKIRHQLLERTGFYKKVTPKTKATSKNIKFKEILTMSDSRLVHYCGVSLEEYYILINIIENEESENLETDSDLESD